MPITKSAKKALRVDRRRNLVNRRVREKIRIVLKEAKKSLSKQAIKNAYSGLDRAAKTNVIHKKKAARLKSRLMAAAAKKNLSKK